MKIILIALAISTSFSALADSSKLVESCRQAGVEKILAQAQANGLTVDLNFVKECGVDSRPLNPSKYVWFCATASNGKKIQVMTQKPLFDKCF